MAPMPEIRFATPAGELPGHLAVPTTPGPWPGVVVLHESFGLTDDIRGWAARFAAEGYLTVAPDLFGWGPTLTCLLAAFRALNRGQGRQLEDIEAARAMVAGHEHCTGKVGVVGFCLGGGFALLAAPRSGFAAAAPNYGEVPARPEEALRGACPVVASYGAKDRMLPGRAARLEAALSAVGVAHDVKEYPDANHSFLNHHSGPLAPVARVLGIGLHEPSADDAWRRVLAFFDLHVRTA
jgi:carboxymethylenebutenolidase